MTVRELVQRLSLLPSDTVVVIEDADTHWKLDVTNIENYKTGFVQLGGTYYDENREAAGNG